MTTNRRRLMLAIGAVLLIGGWGTCGYAKRHDQVGTLGRARIDAIPHTTVWDRDFAKTYLYGIAAMAIGAGLIGFAVLRPTARNDE